MTTGTVINGLISLRNGRKIEGIHTQINSQQDRLITAISAQLHLEGAAQERTEERDRQNNE